MLALDGCIYGIPCNATKVLKVNPLTGEVSTFGPELAGQQKWYGGLLGEDGCVYGIPNCATGVLKINPTTQEVTTLGSLPEGGWKWHGGVCGEDGCIYGVPAHATSVLKIDPRTGEVKTIGGPLDSGTYRPDGKFKWGGAVHGPDGCIYCIPSDADRVLKVVLKTEEEGILKIVPGKSVEMLGGPWEGSDKWEGGVVGSDNCMYCMPQRGKYVLRILPETLAYSSADKQQEQEEIGKAQGAETKEQVSADAILPWKLIREQLMDEKYQERLQQQTKQRQQQQQQQPATSSASPTTSPSPMWAPSRLPAPQTAPSLKQRQRRSEEEKKSDNSEGWAFWDWSAVWACCHSRDAEKEATKNSRQSLVRPSATIWRTSDWWFGRRLLAGW
mmetsp:Transcript_30396/g.45838  ORF Transcript_30396/g.45838 Transcript_30396/m.45838 type:complete len:386 (-) Transcript_30396:11-1168(-)